jgi:hypothetical protein
MIRLRVGRGKPICLYTPERILFRPLEVKLMGRAVIDRLTKLACAGGIPSRAAGANAPAHKMQEGADNGCHRLAIQGRADHPCQRA